MTKKTKIIHTVGKRKRAIARATLKLGSGNIRVNGLPVSMIKPKFVRMRIEEPLIIAEKIVKDLKKTVDIKINVRGGGVWGQADAVRTAIGNALAKLEPKLKPVFLEYDRSILVSDSRRTEPHKPSRSSAGPRRKKQQSKR
ncbi:MAG: 30S ribosomal protein S9 [Candidatus Aenigmatarchaeota archaeon]|nr:30S ribosomal protein S9 [Candidatus Aenigmarchaeota archaeon]RLJ04906.1 MAG: 30S ribosomal protein S9 [Candidatus Aenigmarchaeota archaeon]